MTEQLTSRDGPAPADVSVVILSHNRLADVRRNLSELLAGCQGAGEFQIVVVDNDSTDGTPEFLRQTVAEHPWVEVVFSAVNLGVGAGRNAGFALANRRFVVSLDDDSAIAVEDLRRVPDLFQQNPYAGLLAFRIVHPLTGILQNAHGNKPCLVANHHGAGFAIRRDLYRILEGISEACDYGADELDLAVRVHAAGMQIRYTPEITVLHNTLGRDVATEEWRLERLIFNNVRVFHAHFPTLVAARQTIRYLVPYLGVWYLMYGVRHIHRACLAAVGGRALGRSLHKPVPAATVQYYTNKHLRPECGNIPLPGRVWTWIRKGRHVTAPPIEGRRIVTRRSPATAEKTAGRTGTGAAASVSVVILSHNRLVDLRRNLINLLEGASGEGAFEVIVVDNNSTDGTREYLADLERLNPALTLVLNDENLGVGPGRNKGYAVARGQFIVALDDDSFIAVSDVRAVPGLFAASPDAGVLAFRVVHPLTGLLENPHGVEPTLVANHHGAGFALRREVFEKIGGIDRECDYGAEELDFAIRAHAAGWQIRYSPEITVFHNTLQRDRPEEQRRLERRIYNNIRVLHKYLPRRMADRHSVRYFVTALWAWFRFFGFRGVGRALRAALKGRSAGLGAHRKVPVETVMYYSDRRLRPEVGNVPLTEKVWRRLRRPTLRASRT